MPRFYRSEGRAGAPITKDWIEESLVLRDGAEAMDADKTQFRRVIRGLNTLFKGLKGRNRPESSSPVCSVVGSPHPSENR